MKVSLLVLIGSVIFITGCQLKSKGDIVISQLKKSSKLSTLEVVVTKNIFSKGDNKKWREMFKLGPNEVLLFKSEARIKLGIDLSKISSEDIKYLRGNRIDIELPPVEVTNFSYPAEKFVLDSVISDINKIKKESDFERIDDLFRQAEMDIWNKIELLDVRDKAQEKTRFLMEKILYNMGFEAINISFKEPGRIYAFPVDSALIPN